MKDDLEQQSIQRQVVIVGAGTGGVSVAARLVKVLGHSSVLLIDPSEKHYYQPLWTLVGGGVVDKETTEKAQREVIPWGVDWLKSTVATFDPENHKLTTQCGKTIHYEYLVVAAGIQIDWNNIPGLAGNLGKHGICSNYSYQFVDKTWDMIKQFRGGRALFTHPNTPIKCGGAPQKIMYLADEALRQRKVREQSEIHFFIAKPVIFAVKKYAETLTKVCQRKDIKCHFNSNLVALEPQNQKAVFKYLESGEETTEPYNLIHVTPPMSSPDFLKHSPLADSAGWVDVDQQTMQHKKYANVFALGDCSNVPTSKTGAAIRKQAPVVANNLLAQIYSEYKIENYNGYTSCPLVTGYGKLVLAEFGYDKQPDETFPFCQGKERWSMYQMKRHLLPQLYWHGMLKGRA